MIRGIVAIVGRPNVGKSTLFNRLTRSDTAIVDDRPGVTRDRLYGTVYTSEDRQDGFVVVDTGGFETDDFKFQPFKENLVWKQTAAAISEADLIVFVADGQEGPQLHDRILLQEIKKAAKPCIAVVNKIDGIEYRERLFEFCELGMDIPMSCSAAHNRGIRNLIEQITEQLDANPHLKANRDMTPGRAIAIIGRPNAGKSSILNRMVGEDRSLVSEIAGTTRDAIDTNLVYNGQTYTLIDTAGIRRRARISEKLESQSVIRSIRAIDRADVVFLVLDAMEGLSEQDMRLAQLAADRMKPMAIIVNKWDLIPEKTTNTARDYASTLHGMLKTMSYVPVKFISCLENKRVHSLMELAVELLESASRRVETSKVNEVLQQIVREHNPALIKGKTRRIKFYFATQVATQPPTIVIFCNVVREIQESYIRYMTHRMREMLGFHNVPLRLYFRPKHEQGRRPPRERNDDVVPQALEAEGALPE